MEFIREGNALVCRRLGETLRLEPWGRDALRVRASMGEGFDAEPWALTESPETADSRVEIAEDGASVSCGSLRAEVNLFGVISFYRGEKLLLREFYRNYEGTYSRESRCLKLVSREWKGVIGGGEYSLTVRFESYGDLVLQGDIISALILRHLPGVIPAAFDFVQCIFYAVDINLPEAVLFVILVSVHRGDGMRLGLTIQDRILIDINEDTLHTG